MPSSSLWPSIYQVMKRHPTAVAASVGLHVVLLVLLSLSLSSSEIPEQPKPQANTVKAVVVDAKKIDDELNRRKQAELKRKKEAEKKRQAELKRKKEAERKKKLEAERKRKEEQKRLAAVEAEKKRKEEARKKKLAEEAEKKRLAEAAEKKRLAEEAEKKRLAEEAERKRKEEQARQKKLAAEAEQRRLAEEAELKRRLAEEEQRNAEHNRMLNSLRLQYVKSIEQRVESKWRRPSSLNPDQSCEVLVRQNGLGDVLSVNLSECSNNVEFKNSIERAVWAASPLPPAPNPEVFDNEIHFTFRPRS